MSKQYTSKYKLTWESDVAGEDTIYTAWLEDYEVTNPNFRADLVQKIMNAFTGTGYFTLWRGVKTEEGVEWDVIDRIDTDPASEECELMTRLQAEKLAGIISGDKDEETQPAEIKINEPEFERAVWEAFAEHTTEWEPGYRSRFVREFLNSLLPRVQ